MEGISHLVPEIVRAYAGWVKRRFPMRTTRASLAQAGARTIREFDVECRVRHAPGDVNWVAARGTAEYDTDGRLLRVLDVGILDLSVEKQAEEQRRHAHEDLEAAVSERTAELARANERLRAEIAKRQQVEDGRLQLLNRLVYAEDEERRRIAREMHDQCGQNLTALKLQAARLKERCGQTALGGEVEALEAMAARLDQDIDFLVWELRPTVLDGADLRAALAKYVDNWSAHFGIPVDLHASGTFERVTSKINSALYRIAQETLTNVARHARATRVGVRLEGDGEQVALVVEDDGVGFDPQSTSMAGRGLGLLGMQERAALVAGTLHVESAVGRGTTILVQVPTAAL